MSLLDLHWHLVLQCKQFLEEKVASVTIAVLSQQLLVDPMMAAGPQMIPCLLPAEISALQYSTPQPLASDLRKVACPLPAAKLQWRLWSWLLICGA
jgi:hypothetical protein